LASPPKRGKLQREFEALAKRTWRHPSSGLPVRFGVSTIERWYSAEQIVLRSQDRGEVESLLIINNMADPKNSTSSA
jgi:hypothetical protein